MPRLGKQIYLRPRVILSTYYCIPVCLKFHLEKGTCSRLQDSRHGENKENLIPARKIEKKVVYPAVFL
ncbi:MAG: hypothetical protein OP8BY_0640 [Candidatus Saccharicenans subterraneus]|uniref:Uncharacterized protein n=1 Tax=Candidatus Saccharicenans subterraneus TaxID=2508984 RepID=A0A3E2BKN4_9BACT|nr:MAG: hypothetical protein OP8BY_0640 [Candidatus Saccharicenans subterraneum]